MILYEQQDRYDERTGKKLQRGKVVQVGYLCDYCGRKIDRDHDIEDIPIKLTPEEYDGLEPMFHDMGGELPCDIYDLMNGHPQFIYCDNDELKCSIELCKEAIKKPKQGHHNSLTIAMYECRVKLLEMLLKEETYTLQDFNLE